VINLREGLPYPCGATWGGIGTHFPLFSAQATRVELCPFDARRGRETERITLPEYSKQILHGRLAAVGNGTFYGHRVHGTSMDFDSNWVPYWLLELLTEPA
jgi:isoamylase